MCLGANESDLINRFLPSGILRALPMYRVPKGMSVTSPFRSNPSEGCGRYDKGCPCRGELRAVGRTIGVGNRYREAGGLRDWRMLG